MKYIIIIVILLSVSTFSNAETNKHMNTTRTIECPVDLEESNIGHITFYGVLDIWETPAGGIVISCIPPFLEVCYRLIWSNDNPAEKTVYLNDDNQTEIDVTSDVVISTGENGEQIHTFSR
jgi:hypothetical protein